MQVRLEIQLYLQSASVSVQVCVFNVADLSQDDGNGEMVMKKGYRSANTKYSVDVVLKSRALKLKCFVLTFIISTLPTS
jgi:hypothetical protein